MGRSWPASQTAPLLPAQVCVFPLLRPAPILTGGKCPSDGVLTRDGERNEMNIVAQGAILEDGCHLALSEVSFGWVCGSVGQRSVEMEGHSLFGLLGSCLLSIHSASQWRLLFTSSLASTWPAAEGERAGILPLPELSSPARRERHIWPAVLEAVLGRLVCVHAPKTDCPLGPRCLCSVTLLFTLQDVCEARTGSSRPLEMSCSYLCKRWADCFYRPSQMEKPPFLCLPHSPWFLKSLP